MVVRVLALFVLVISMTGSLMAQDVVDGRIGPGSLYRMVRPANWNGGLVLYAHGFVDADLPVALPAEADALVGLLVPNGFAVAYSSFSENGWNVKDGAQRTLQLLQIFKSKFGHPTHVYLGGASMGGLVTAKLIEDHPGFFDGALAACAAVGGTRAQFDYVANTRVLFDLFYPGVLPGTVADVPAGIEIFAQIVGPATAAMTADPTGAFAMTQIVQTPIPFAIPAEVGPSILTALVSHAGGFEDIMSRTHGRASFDNSETIYTGTLDPFTLAAINAGVQRLEASPGALNFMEHNDNPTGALQIPLLMLSTSRDPVIPAFHQGIYASKVAAAGRMDLLLERTIDRYGHCNFTPEELAQAFLDLVFWVQFGIKPVA